MKTQQPSLRCVNCGIRVPQNSRVAKDQSLDIQDLLNQWILPKEVCLCRSYVIYKQEENQYSYFM